MKTKKVIIYDTTLRDGTQAEKISFSVEDKILIAKKLDDLGIHFIEGGWPGSNPKDAEFFDRIKNIPLKRSLISAFGSTRHRNNPPSKDPNIQALVKASTPAVTIFGKTWELHVRTALKCTLEQNLEMIYSSVKYLKDQGKIVFYDAEHFFDGFKANKDYAAATLMAARQAGADALVLCETNGGCLPNEIKDIMNYVSETLTGDFTLGIHAHNDAECGVANSITGVLAGARQVQGTINGFGERCGNANLCSIIPNLQIKLGYSCLTANNLKKLTGASKFVSELANLPHDHRLPYVGESAFAHKGGIHVSAVLKNPATYEHVNPELTGNKRRVLLSDLSGRSNIVYKFKELKINIDETSPEIKNIVNHIKDLENQGYQFEAADASFELLVKKLQGHKKAFFKLEGFRVINEKKSNQESYCEATIKVLVGNKEFHTAAEGDGPVNALDNALKKALINFYPQINKIKLEDFKVRVLNEQAGTGAKVRVLMEFSDGKNFWGTVGCSENIVEASWQALVDGIDYKLGFLTNAKKNKN